MDYSEFYDYINFIGKRLINFQMKFVIISITTMQRAVWRIFLGLLAGADLPLIVNLLGDMKTFAERMIKYQNIDFLELTVCSCLSKTHWFEVATSNQNLSVN